MLNEYMIASSWRLQRLIEKALVKYNPLNISDRNEARDTYGRVTKPIAARLARVQRKPKVEQAALIIWGILLDTLGGSPTYDEKAYLPLAKMIDAGWDDRFIR
jgi:hypothetical protein